VPELIVIPAGRVWMGGAADPDARPNEHPSGWVEVPAFAIARTPVTVAAFARFVAAGGAPPRRSWGGPHPPAGYDQHPITNVAWGEAAAYCAWLSAHTGQPFRLPGEAEWERAARGATRRRWPWGDTFDVRCANTCEAGHGGTTPVDAHPQGASPFGVLDLAGNVWEWTADICRPYPYAGTAAPVPLLPPELSESRRRVLRGGSCMAEARWARCSSRVAWRPFYIFSGQVGFRVACSIEEQPS
jgi:formylglycine-generating enzyme required for sulfatase activity